MALTTLLFQCTLTLIFLLAHASHVPPGMLTSDSWLLQHLPRLHNNNCGLSLCLCLCSVQLRLKDDGRRLGELGHIDNLLFQNMEKRVNIRSSEESLRRYRDLELIQTCFISYKNRVRNRMIYCFLLQSNLSWLRLNWLSRLSKTSLKRSMRFNWRMKLTLTWERLISIDFFYPR